MSASSTAATDALVPAPRELPDYTPADGEARQLIQMGPRMSWAAELRCGTRVFVLTSPLWIDVSYEEDGVVVASHARLPVIGTGSSLKEALDDFSFMFEVQWDALVACDPRELAPSGARAREALKAVVQEVRDSQ